MAISGKKDKSQNSDDFADMDMPTNAELDALQAQIESIQDEQVADILAQENKAQEDNLARIEALESEVAALKDQALRAMAETENIKKRAEREVKAASLYGIERFAMDVVSVGDNLGRALMTMDGKAKEDLGENAKNLLEGIELTQKELMAIFARHGIKAVPGKGSKFDPNFHQAVAQIPSDEDKGFIAEVMQTGFTLGDRTLRAAMVAVSTGKAKN